MEHYLTYYINSGIGVNMPSEKKVRDEVWRNYSHTHSDLGAQDWIRTSMPLTAPPPQDGMSTNFTTWAYFYKNKHPQGKFKT